MDEPTAGLDPEVAREVRDLIVRLREEGRTILLSTYNLAEAEQLCDRITVVRTRLVALGSPADLRQRVFRRRVMVRLDIMDNRVLMAVRGLKAVRSVEQDGGRLLVELEDPERGRPDLVQGIVEAGGRVLEVSEEEHALGDVYLSLVREGGGTAWTPAVSVSGSSCGRSGRCCSVA